MKNQFSKFKLKKYHKFLIISLVFLFFVWMILPHKLPLRETSDVDCIITGGYFAVSDDIICVIPNIDTSILLEHLSPSAKEKKIVVLPENTSNAQIYGDDVYYTRGEPGSVMRLNSDLFPQLVVLTEAYDMMVQNGRIYWEDGNNTLFMSNGTLLKTKIADHVSHYATTREAVYYYDFEACAINRYDFSAKQHTCISKKTNGHLANLLINEEYLYYSTFDQVPGEAPKNGKLYRMALDGSETTMILERGASTLNFHDNYLFYRDSSDTNLYRANMDGTDIKLLYEGQVGTANIIEDKIVFERVYNWNGHEAGYYLGDFDGNEEVYLGPRFMTSLEILKKMQGIN